MEIKKHRHYQDNSFLIEIIIEYMGKKEESNQLFITYALRVDIYGRNYLC